jgi:ribosomal protein S27E
MTVTDSIVDRARRVRPSLVPEGSPQSVQVTVDGPCPDCGNRFVVDVHADTATVTCPGCEKVYAV